MEPTDLHLDPAVLGGLLACLEEGRRLLPPDGRGGWGHAPAPGPAAYGGCAAGARLAREHALAHEGLEEGVRATAAALARLHGSVAEVGALVRGTDEAVAAELGRGR